MTEVNWLCVVVVVRNIMTYVPFLRLFLIEVLSLEQWDLKALRNMDV